MFSLLEVVCLRLIQIKASTFLLTMTFCAKMSLCKPILRSVPLVQKKSSEMNSNIWATGWTAMLREECVFWVTKMPCIFLTFVCALLTVCILNLHGMKLLTLTIYSTAVTR